MALVAQCFEDEVSEDRDVLLLKNSKHSIHVTSYFSLQICSYLSGVWEDEMRQ